MRALSLSRKGWLFATLAAGFLVAGGIGAQAAGDPPRSHPDIFAGTIAEMTWPEVEKAAQEGAVLLWALGVIEQHGPHLPTGTDVYVPQARLREVQRLLAAKGMRALIVPPYYWGVNHVSGSFPASYSVRPEVMVEVMSDVFSSIAKEKFRHVFCISGHGDALHNQAIYDGVKAGAARAGIDVSFVVSEALAKRMGLAADDRLLTLYPGPGGPPPKFMDVHAGSGETSAMMHSYTGLVRDDVRQTLKSTDFEMPDLLEWRKGLDDARRKTPLGYLGDPAAATAEAGARSLAQAAQAMADVIERRVRGAK